MPAPRKGSLRALAVYIRGARFMVVAMRFSVVLVQPKAYEGIAYLVLRGGPFSAFLPLFPVQVNCLVSVAHLEWEFLP